MGVLSVVATVVLVIINVFVAIFAFFFFLVGIAMAMMEDLMKKHAWPLLEEILQNANPSGGTISPNIFNDPDLDLFGLLKKLAIPIIIVCLVIFVISFLGCYGACYKNKIMIGIYATVMTLLTIAVVIGIAIVWANLQNYVNQFSMDTSKAVTTRFVREDANDAVSVIFGILQTLVGCCGAIDGSDYATSTVLDRSKFPGMQIPISCCKTPNSLSQTQSQDCVAASYQDPAKTNYHEGCVSKAVTSLEKYFQYVFGGLLGTAIFLLILSVLGWILFAVALKKDKVSVV